MPALWRLHAGAPTLSRTVTLTLALTPTLTLTLTPRRRVTDTDKLARGPTDVSLMRGPPEAEHVRYPHFVQTGDFPICGIPGC